MKYVRELKDCNIPIIFEKKKDKDHDTSYMKNNGTESKISSDVAISSGSITIKNTEK